MSADYVLQQVDSVRDHCLNGGIVPIICTIPPINFADYNHDQSEIFQRMTVEGVEILATVNDGIVARNSQLRLSTPLLHKDVLRPHGTGSKKRVKAHWDFYHDGLHPFIPGPNHIGKTPLQRWANSIQSAVIRND